MLATMTRFYDDGFNEMDRYRNWPPQFHCYDERPNPMHFSYAEGRAARTAPHGRPDRLLPDAPGQDQTSSNPSRRRIAVACSRCRKRKIKCSGDTGSGMGCQNCRIAGVGSSCNFTRVGSLEVNMNQPSGGVSSNNISPGHDDRLHMLNAQQEYHYAQPPLRLMTGNFSVNPYYAADSQYDTDSQSDNYMLSPATPLTPNDAYTAYPLPDSTRNWPSYSNRYVSSYARYSSYDQAPYTTELSTRTRPAMTDGSSGVFSTHGLHMSLPNPVPGGRELPPPTVGARSQIQTQSYEASHLRSEAYSKPYSYWPSGQATAGARNGSIASSRSSELVAPILQKPSTTPTIGSDHSPLTLLPSSTGCPDISPMATTTNAEHTDAETSLSQHRGLGIEHHSLYGIPTASVSETRIEHARPPSNTYTFSIAPRGHQIHNELPSGSEDGQIGTSSATYVPIQYPAEPSDARTYSLGSSRHGSINNRIHALSQRSSVLSMRQDH